MTSKRLRLLRAELKRKCNKLLRRSQRWRMKWTISSLRLMTWRSCSTRRKSDLPPSNKWFSCTSQAYLSRWLITPWSMIPKRIKFYNLISIIDSMTLKRNWLITSLKFMQSNNILNQREQSLTTKEHSKIAWLFAMISIWI